jgi:ABC-type sugar transport system substrate-binding protein
MTSQRRQKSPLRRSVTFAALVAAIAIVAAGCGSSSSNTSSSSGSSASSGAAASSTTTKEAQAAAQKYATLPTSLNLPPVSKSIPSGKTVTYVHCGVEVCSTIVKAIKNAADVLGWKTKIVPSAGTPPSVKQAWGNVVRIKPAAAFGSGFDATLYASELKQLKAENVPVMSWATLDKEGNGIVFAKGGPDEVGIVGEQQAAWVVSSTGGKANTVYVDLPTYTILKPVRLGFEKAYKQWCPGCAYDTMSVPLTAIGKDAPSRIVSYLRSHPKVNRVALSYDGVGVGLPAALKAAGLAGKVQFVGEAPTATNLAYVKAGTEGATVSQGYYEIWATFVDAAARAATGQSLAPDQGWKPPWFLVTKDNIDKVGTNFGPVVPNLNEQLKKLWNKA